MLEMLTGKSEKDRIKFYTDNNVATAIRNEEGEITIEFGKEDTVNSTRKDLVSVGVFFSIPFIAKFLLICLIENKTIEMACYLIPTILCSILVLFAIISRRKEGGKEFLRNHGAEHMVFAAYRKLKRIPTLEEAKLFSRINKYCGITRFSSFITSQLIGFIVYICIMHIIQEQELIFILITELVSYSALIFLILFPIDLLGKVLQLFTTSKPNECNIELAITALIALENQELSDDIR